MKTSLPQNARITALKDQKISEQERLIEQLERRARLDAAKIEQLESVIRKLQVTIPAGS